MAQTLLAAGGTAVLAGPSAAQRQPTAAQRRARPADVTNVTAFFQGSDSSFITGEVLHIAGGLQLTP